jgi:hypothetical protein
MWSVRYKIMQSRNSAELMYLLKASYASYASLPLACLSASLPPCLSRARMTRFCGGPGPSRSWHPHCGCSLEVSRYLRNVTWRPRRECHTTYSKEECLPLLRVLVTLPNIAASVLAQACRTRPQPHRRTALHRCLPKHHLTRPCTNYDSDVCVEDACLRVGGFSDDLLH